MTLTVIVCGTPPTTKFATGLLYALPVVCETFIPMTDERVYRYRILVRQKDDSGHLILHIMGATINHDFFDGWKFYRAMIGSITCLISRKIKGEANSMASPFICNGLPLLHSLRHHPCHRYPNRLDLHWRPNVSISRVRGK
jgi:hypothetical protein